MSRQKVRTKGQKRGRGTNAEALAQVQHLLGEASRQRDLLIEHLHRIQDSYHYISADHLVALAEEMKLPQAEVFEVATFYHHFDVVTDGTAPPPLTVRVCESLSCALHGSDTLCEQLQQLSSTEVRIQKVPCVGRCQDAPVAVVGTNPIDQADLEKVTDAVQQNQIQARLPESYIDYAAYISDQGYRTFDSAYQGSLSMDDIIDQLDHSGLRGLGGAGFPASRKWRILRDQPAPRYLAVNIDEGEPGTFKDRYYLERDPHRFLEGMLIAALAIQATDIYIYLRDEYASLRLLLQQELDVLKTEMADKLPEIHLRRGAGAYICGEESAMIESLEGKRGMPRLRPPYLAEVGLFGRPTLEHNMETLYWVRDILEKGADWFVSHGRHGRQGLRSFSVSGRVKNPGVHLAPAGITLQELVDEYCGGMMDGHELYGYFPGGASGGMLPATLSNIPLDFDTLQEYGCFIGSAAVIVFSNHDSARDLALNAMEFFKHESCGQCTPCRVGTAKASDLMQQQKWDIPLLEELSEVMIDASICGLGQAAPNPLRCAVKYFPQEFE
jgi:formate dehydrogenase beta subunit